MTPSSLAGHLIELLSKIEKTDLPADKIISDFFRQRRYLGSHDRRWISGKIYGIIRNHILLTEIGRNSFSESKTAETFLTYELLFAGMNAESIHDTYSQLLESYKLAGREIDLARLSDLVTMEFERLKSDKSESILNSFPEFFSQMLPSNVRDEYVPMMKALNQEARVCIRVDTSKVSRDEAMEKLRINGIESAPTKFSPFGLYLSKRINLNNLDLYKEGKIEIQEEASQLVGVIVEPQKDEIIIDACAGAGGKSVELASISGGRSKIFALDVNKERLDNLKVRAMRTGCDNINSRVVTGNDLAGLEDLISNADKVVVDAPCSGSGTIRRNPDKKFRLTKSYVENKMAHQNKLIDNYSRLVKVGGLLFYITCSVFEGENQSIVKSFVESNQNFRFVDLACVLKEPKFSSLIEDGFLTIYPHRVEMDGFFAAVMKRVG